MRGLPDQNGADGNPMTATVVICAYTMSRWDYIVRAVDSVRAQSMPAHQIMVVTDHNAELYKCAQQDLDDVVVLENAGARGLSGARNTAIAAVETEFVAFLDDDAAAAPDWLELLLACYDDPDVVAVGGTAAPAWPTRRPAMFPAAEGAAGEFDWVVGCSYAGQPEQPTPVRNLMGCNMSFRASLFAEVGGFAEHLGRLGTLPLGCEETELCIRARQRDPRRVVMFVPRALVHHRVGEERIRWRYLLRRCWSEGRSKASISALIGNADALSSERDYVARVLPRAVVRQLARGSRLQRHGFSGAAAIGLGLSTTAAGYTYGMARSWARAMPVSGKRGRRS